MNRLNRIVPILLLCAFLTGAASLSARAVTAGQYRKILAGVQHTLESASEASHKGAGIAGETPHAYASRVLAPVRTIESAGQGTVRVSSAKLVAAIQKADAAPVKQRAGQYRAIIVQLKTLRGDMRGVTPGDVGGGDDPPSAYVELTRILSRREFQSEPLNPPSPLEIGLNHLWKWITDHFPKAQRNTGGHISPAAIRALFYSLGALLFGLLVYLIVQFIRSRRVNVVQRDREQAEEAMVEARDTVSLLDAAEARAKDGDYRGAFRLVYLATLVAMDTDGILRFDRSRTNWEYLRALRGAGRGDLYTAMLPLTRDFDRLWYGYATAGAPDYRKALDYYERLRGAKSAAQRT